MPVDEPRIDHPPGRIHRPFRRIPVQDLPFRAKLNDPSVPYGHRLVHPIALVHAVDACIVDHQVGLLGVVAAHHRTGEQ